MTYLEKLKHPKWQKKRLEILKRDDWKCVICGAKDKTLHVHHLFYFANMEPWEVHNGFVITLCNECHQEERNIEFNASIKIELGGLLNELWKNGYGNYLLSVAYAFHEAGKLEKKQNKLIEIEMP